MKEELRQKYQKSHIDFFIPLLLTIEELMEGAAAVFLQIEIEQRKHFKPSSSEYNLDKSSGSDTIYAKFPDKVKYENNDLTTVV